MKTYLYDLYAAFLKHKKIVTDSREIVPGCIFFALKGEKFNGNAFAGEALDNGAALAVIDEQKYFSGSRCFVVNNVLQTLQELALHHRSQLKIPILGITGTNGKTTTKELISAILSRKFKTCSTKGNLNNHIGVPISILQIKADDEIAVIEMGANHQGEIAALCTIAQPNFGIITNIGKAHLEGFGSHEGVITAKNELYEYIRKNNGHVFVNSSDDLLMNLTANIERTTFGAKDFADKAGVLSGSFPYISVKTSFGKVSQTINSKLVGTYNFENILAAACIGDYFGVKPAWIKSAIEGYSPANNRSQVIETEKNKLILDAYNANPTSMEAAIRSFADYPVKNKVIIAGDMLELGSASLLEHLRILEIINSLGFNEVLLVGKFFARANQNPGFHAFLTISRALHFLKGNPLNGKTILIKGSRGIMLEKLLPRL